MFNLFLRFDLTTLLRLQAFQTAKNLFFTNPILGVGTGGFEQFSALVYPHNVILELASELGIFGVIAFTIMIIYAMFLGIKLLRSQIASALEQNLSKVFFALLLFSLINSQISGEISGNYELWFSVAGIWTLYSTKERY
jgi:O-antigen ligase